MSSSNQPPENEAAGFFHQKRKMLNSKTTEGDVKSQVVEPILETLGFDRESTSGELTSQAVRPDFCIFQDRQDYENARDHQPGNPAIIIVEVKRPAVKDLDQWKSRNSPVRQLARYLWSHNQAGQDTLGILTNGTEWRVYKRGSGNSITLVKGTADSSAEEVFRCITKQEIPVLQPNTPDTDPERSLLQVLAGGITDYLEIAKLLFNQNIQDHNFLKEPQDAYAKQAFHSDWEKNSAWICTGPKTSDSANHLNLNEPPMGDQNRLHLGIVKIHPNLPNIEKQDISSAKRGFEEICGKAPLLILAVMQTSSNAEKKPTARLALSWNGTLSMTSEFSVPHAQATPRLVLKKIMQETRSQSFDTKRTLEHLSLKPLQKLFYEEIQKWTVSCPGWSIPSGNRNSKQAKDTRTAILRNLLRVMFCYILKQRGTVPEDIFWPEDFGKLNQGYHKKVLSVFFHDILNRPKNERKNFRNPEIKKIAQVTPFLNGSIFAKQIGDDDLKIDASLYRNEDPDNLGLFDIMEKYNWTANEHRNGETDQSLDPDLLGNILERFISMLDNSDETVQSRQPDGTYYTEKNVVQEMVFRSLQKHAKNFHKLHPALDLKLAESIFRRRPLTKTKNPDAPTLAEFRKSLTDLKIADLATGSAIFLVEIIHTIQEAIFQIDILLDMKEPNREQILSTILKQQIHGWRYTTSRGHDCKTANISCLPLQPEKQQFPETLTQSRSNHYLCRYTFHVA